MNSCQAKRQGIGFVMEPLRSEYDANFELTRWKKIRMALVQMRFIYGQANVAR